MIVNHIKKVKIFNILDKLDMWNDPTELFC